MDLSERFLLPNATDCELVITVLATEFHEEETEAVPPPVAVRRGTMNNEEQQQDDVDAGPLNSSPSFSSSYEDDGEDVLDDGEWKDTAEWQKQKKAFEELAKEVKKSGEPKTLCSLRLRVGDLVTATSPTVSLRDYSFPKGVGGSRRIEVKVLWTFSGPSTSYVA